MIASALAARCQARTVDLASCCTWRIGGPATLLTVDAVEDLRALREDGALRVLGSGANLLIGDDGVPEPVLRLGPAFAALSIDADRGLVRAGAALDLAKLVNACVKAGLAGPEGLAGVPASVGGAVHMNAGTAQCWILDHTARVEVLLPDRSQACWLDRAELPARYRHCGLPAGAVVLGCELYLPAGDPELLRREAARLKQAKASSQPLAARSAGCVFKNPRPDLPAGRLIDELGLKGSRVGAAVVSSIHANFIINEGGARAAEVCELIRRIRQRARQERGVELELEVQLWNLPAGATEP